MDQMLTALVGILFGLSAYLMLSLSLVRILFGIALLSNGVNILLLVAGRVTRMTPPIIVENRETLDPLAANPLPQALILTAIVISFSLFSFVLVLARCVNASLGHDNVSAMSQNELLDSADWYIEKLSDADPDTEDSPDSIQLATSESEAVITPTKESVHG